MAGQISNRGLTKAMGTDLNAEILVRIAHRQELIEKSNNIIVISKALIEQSQRRIRIAMGHDVDEEVVRTRETSLKSRGK
jgi:hypothetical protein